MHLIGLKIQNHKFEIAFSSDSEGLNWSVVDLVNVVVDLVTVVAFFAVVADVVDILFSSDSGWCSWEWCWPSSLGTDCSKSSKTQPSLFKIQLFKGGSHDLKVHGN